jgi:hypothetical protein
MEAIWAEFFPFNLAGFKGPNDPSKFVPAPDPTQVPQDFYISNTFSIVTPTIFRVAEAAEPR